jgi:dTDP-4-amino-4,6-dideoxygalactose transaminase
VEDRDAGAATEASAEPLSISAPRFDAEVEASVLAVLRSGHVAQGNVVAEFERQCAAMAGTSFAVAVANGTLALEAALEVIGVGPGDEVITTPLTFAATINAVLRTGATVRFADIDETYTVNPGSVRSLVNERTRVLLPVHLYGLMADMDEIAAIAAAHSLAIVEDAAQAHGARRDDRHAGGTGLGCFSFYATKNITSAEGGMLTTSDEGIAQRLRTLRNQGMEGRYHYVAVGRNLRLTDLAAAVAVPQMRQLADINVARARNAKMLSDAIAARDLGVVPPPVPPHATHVWHQYTVLLPDGAARDSVVGRMLARGVATGVYYPRLAWDYDCYRDHPGVATDPTPEASNVASRCLSLPVHQHLTEVGLERIVDALAAAL